MVGKRCIIYNCETTSENHNETLHRMPINEDRIGWICFIRHENGAESFIPNTVYLCAKHFNPSSFDGNTLNRRRILAGHFPSVVPRDDATLIHTEVIQECISDENLPDAVNENHDDMNIKKEIEDLKQQLSQSNQALINLNLKYQAALKELRTLRQFRSRSDNKKTLKRATEMDFGAVKRLKSSSKSQDSSYDTLPFHNLISQVFRDVTTKAEMKLKKYSEVIREFAFRLHYLSPRAYSYMRDVFGTALPHPRNFSRWTKYIDTSPGFIPVSLNFIKNQNLTSSHRIHYALIFDEISIRKQIIYSNGKMTGYVNYGGILEQVDVDKEAKSALFILASEINGRKKIPIGYILTNGLSAELMSKVIRDSLVKMDELDASVVSVTFDGLKSNFSSMELLGANLDINSSDLKTYINHPSNGSKVYVIPDPVHMMKLLRNTLQAYKILINEDGKKIEWKFLWALLNVQSDSGLRAGNKITKRHIQFYNQKMKVKLCAQTISNSVAIAIEVCRLLKLWQFDGSEATSDFLRLFDRLFDALNSRPMGQGFKSPLQASNKESWTSLFSQCDKYLRNLKCINKHGEEVLLSSTQRGTCVRGLVICIRSISGIMDDILTQQLSDLVYLPVYKLSQDMIELFFSIIRSRFGFNNNPNVFQLEHALKGILCTNMELGLNGNCIAQEDLDTRVSPIGNTLALRDSLNQSSQNFQDSIEESEDCELPENIFLSPYVRNVVSYIAGFVGRNLSKKLNCPSCIAALIQKNVSSIPIRSDFILLNAKNNGGLFIPSDDLIEVCKSTETEVRRAQPNGLVLIDKKKLINRTLRNCNNPNIFTHLRTTNLDSHELFSTHTLDLIRSIAEQYLKVRLNYLAKEATINLSPETNRNKCNKLVHFQGN